MINKEYFGEDKKIEFKREIPKKHENFLKDIIAFSNSNGGKVIVGIGEISTFKLSDACTPQIEANISINTVENKTVLEIDVPPGKFSPYYLTNKGKDSSTYIRVNGTSRPADARKLQELELEGQGVSYDTLRDIGKVFDKGKVLQLCLQMKSLAMNESSSEEEKTAVKDMTIEKLEDFGILCKVGRDIYPTHAFDLFMENSNRNAKIQCALFKGNTRDFFIDRKEFDGPIQYQINGAYNFVLRHINMGSRIEGLYRNDMYELPVSAIREMITNTILHRSYLDKSCVQESIFDDRIEVLSPGSLYNGLDIETAKKEKSTCRNEAIAEAFHYMKLVEAWETGIPRMIARCKEYGLLEPTFEEVGDSFLVTIFRKNDKSTGIVWEKYGYSTEKQSNTSTIKYY